MNKIDPMDNDIEHVMIFDTTMRDGEQSPGASMTGEEKIILARQLERLGVDIIEAGFPAASKGDFAAVVSVAKEIKTCTVAALARCNEKDISRAIDSLKDAIHPRLHVFISTSPLHREFKLKMTKEKVKETMIKGIKQAKEFTPDVEFSPEDGARTEIPYLLEIIEAAIDAGATTINIPDTVGYTMPDEFGSLIHTVKTQVPNIDQAVISVHCHNDLGMAVANSLAAIKNGARQVECTINGIGERAGNCALEEIVMALHTRRDVFSMHTQINTKELVPTSHMVSEITSMYVQPNKAIVGANAFAHEAGIHQHGMIANPETYEIINPEMVGTKNSLVLGKHCGRHALIDWMEKNGYSTQADMVDLCFRQMKEFADKHKKVSDIDMHNIAMKCRDNALV